MKHRLIPVAVDTEENLYLLGYRVDLKWSSLEEAKKNNRPNNEIWSEYFFCATTDLQEFIAQAVKTFGPDMIVVKVEEIKIVDWSL